MIECIQDLIETENLNLEEAEIEIAKLEKKWFKFGKSQLITFLEIYIKSKKEFIKELERKLSDLKKDG